MKESFNKDASSSAKKDFSWMWAQGKWNEWKGEFKSKFGKLTDDDMMVMNGKRDIALGLIQKRYAVAKDKAEELLCQWEANCEYCKKNMPKSGSAPMGGHRK